MKSLLIIGLGRFGTHLAMNLMELGNEVMAVDKDEAVVQKLVPSVTRAEIGDCMEVEVLKALGVSNFDICFVCISDEFQASLEITSLLKELGAVKVIAKADRELHAKFLLKVGADEVIYPERDMAKRTAMKYHARNAFDYFELATDYAIAELEVPKSWCGKSLRQLDVRTKHRINVIGVKMDEHVTPMTNPDFAFHCGDRLVIAGRKQDIAAILSGK
ncbi:MAG: ktrA [Firmicutes bacterium]|nr:ktrA [Bacillota bacterium]